MSRIPKPERLQIISDKLCYRDATNPRKRSRVARPPGVIGTPSTGFLVGRAVRNSYLPALSNAGPRWFLRALAERPLAVQTSSTAVP
jgi:hypothetical protein